MNPTPVRLLTIAGSDSGGGAGIQADLKTFSALGGYGLSVVTALTAQNTVGVRGILEVPPGFVADQLEAVLSDIGADAVKIGMLFSPAIVRAVADGLRRRPVPSVVLDPVMVAKSGDRLLGREAIAALHEELIPRATVLTPNLPEAEVLLGVPPIRTPAAQRRAALALLARGPRAVLVKGGHFPGARSDDGLAWQSAAGPQYLRLEAPRLESCNTHGTGCSLSSAIAAYLGRGLDVVAAVREAKAWCHGAIRAGAAWRIGKGHGPIGHFYRWTDGGPGAP